MRVWKSISSLFPTGLSRSYGANYRLATSYQALFEGRGSRDDAEIVLADIANVSGFYRVSPSTFTEAELRHQEGMRALYGRIHSMLRMSGPDMLALENAARVESAIDQQ